MIASGKITKNEKQKKKITVSNVLKNFLYVYNDVA